MDLNILSPYIRLAMYSTLPEKWVLKRRVIYDYEIIYVQGGSCTINVDGRKEICSSNKVIFLRPGIPHSFEVSADSRFIQPHIHFDAVYSSTSTVTPISFKDIPEMSENEKALISSDVFSDIDIPTVFEPEDPKQFKKYFFDLINLYRTDNSDTLRLRSIMLEILRLIIKQFGNEKAEAASRQTQRLNAVIEYIDANHMRSLSLDDISEYFSCNKYTLIRSFRKKYGETVIAYYNRKRFETACSLLENTSLTVKEISDLLNFSDEYTFSRFFKNKMKESPSAYRIQKKDRLI